MIRVFLFVFTFSLLGLIEVFGEGISLVGSNGREATFAGVKKATRAGLEVKVGDDAPAIVIEWNRLNLESLKVRHPAVHDAYLKAISGEEVELNLGVFAAMPEEMSEAKATGVIPGRFEISAGSGKFHLQLPQGRDVRAVLLLSCGPDGKSARYMGTGYQNRWSPLTSKFQMAILAYEFPTSDSAEIPVNVEKVAPFVFPEKGSGESVLKALEGFAGKTGIEALKTCPIAIYGFDVVGAGFAFNFTQLYSDRVIACVAAKGAFYRAPVTDVSGKVPLLMLWGEYDDEPKRWGASHGHMDVFENNRKVKPNWVYAMEPRGLPGESGQAAHFSMLFLDRMILARMNADGTLKEIDRSRSFKGDWEAVSISRLDEGEGAVETGFTWLPDGEVAKLWEDFSNGTLQMPAGDGQ